MIRKGDQVNYSGGLFALQKQAGLSIHLGGKTALSSMRKAHYLDLGSLRIWLFGRLGEKLPAWFVNHDWRVEFKYYTTDFLPPTKGVDFN